MPLADNSAREFPAIPEIALQRWRLVIVQELGLSSWPKLKGHLERVEPLFTPGLPRLA